MIDVPIKEKLIETTLKTPGSDIRVTLKHLKPKCELGGAQGHSNANGGLYEVVSVSLPSPYIKVGDLGMVKTGKIDPIVEPLAAQLHQVAEVPCASMLQMVMPDQNKIHGKAPEEAPNVSLVFSRYEPGAECSDLYKYLGLEKRPLIIGSRTQITGRSGDEATAVLPKLFLSNHCRFEHSLEKIVAMALFTGELDCHTGNIIHVTQVDGQKESLMKIDNGYAFWRIGTFKSPFAPVNLASGIDAVTGKPANHFRDYRFVGNGIFYRSPFFIDAIESLLDKLTPDNIQSQVEFTINNAVSLKILELMATGLQEEPLNDAVIQWLRHDFLIKHCCIDPEQIRSDMTNPLDFAMHARDLICIQLEQRKKDLQDFANQMKKECMEAGVENILRYEPYCKTTLDTLKRRFIYTGLMTKEEASKVLTISQLLGFAEEAKNEEAANLCRGYINQIRQQHEIEQLEAQHALLVDKLKPLPINQCFLDNLQNCIDLLKDKDTSHETLEAVRKRLVDARKKWNAYIRQSGCRSQTSLDIFQLIDSLLNSVSAHKDQRQWLASPSTKIKAGKDLPTIFSPMELLARKNSEHTMACCKLLQEFDTHFSNHLLESLSLKTLFISSFSRNAPAEYRLLEAVECAKHQLQQYNHAPYQQLEIIYDLQLVVAATIYALPPGKNNIIQFLQKLFIDLTALNEELANKQPPQEHISEQQFWVETLSPSIKDGQVPSQQLDPEEQELVSPLVLDRRQRFIDLTSKEITTLQKEINAVHQARDISANRESTPHCEFPHPGNGSRSGSTGVLSI